MGSASAHPRTLCARPCLRVEPAALAGAGDNPERPAVETSVENGRATPRLWGASERAAPYALDAALCGACEAEATGWTCTAGGDAIGFCDPGTGCWSEHPCPGGCAVGAPGVADLCR